MIYKNGNTIVEIREDGTKIRYTPDNKPAMPVYPESIDLHICNCCNMGCAMCHEQSTPDGKLADLKHPLLYSIHPYTELAIGGGDPMMHPGLEEFLKRMKEQAVICNLTVHWKSFLNNYETLKQWTAHGLIHGLGVSINEIVPCDVINKLAEFNNAVVHVIEGLADEKVFRQIGNKNFNVLILGFKSFGRGNKWLKENFRTYFENNKWLRMNMKDIAGSFKAIAFDNKAIDTCAIDYYIEPEMFEQFYMGSDGAFTMYVDLVENKYAISSTRERYDIDSFNIGELFATVRKKVGYANT